MTGTEGIAIVIAKLEFPQASVPWKSDSTEPSNTTHRPGDTTTTMISTTTVTTANDNMTTVYVPLVAQCAAAACYNFVPCSINNTNCACYSIGTGGGICGLNVPCAGVIPCNNETLTCDDSQP
ncbi:unnamed protein product, partial [Adineta steineri]